MTKRKRGPHAPTPAQYAARVRTWTIFQMKGILGVVNGRSYIDLTSEEEAAFRLAATNVLKRLGVPT